MRKKLSLEEKLKKKYEYVGFYGNDLRIYSNGKKTILYNFKTDKIEKKFKKYS